MSSPKWLQGSAAKKSHVFNDQALCLSTNAEYLNSLLHGERHGRMMTKRTSKSAGMPWKEMMSVPRMVQVPLFVAKTTRGLKVDSKAWLKYAKHSMPNM